MDFKEQIGFSLRFLKRQIIGIIFLIILSGIFIEVNLNINLIEWLLVGLFWPIVFFFFGLWTGVKNEKRKS
mgnify:CR=1 FL=1